jgi:hypothetical protein
MDANAARLLEAQKSLELSDGVLVAWALKLELGTVFLSSREQYIHAWLIFFNLAWQFKKCVLDELLLLDWIKLWTALTAGCRKQVNASLRNWV